MTGGSQVMRCAKCGNIFVTGSGTGRGGTSVYCRDELSKHKIVIQAIGLACYYVLERLLGPPPPRRVTLTQREIDVLRLLTEGLSAPAIGKKLYISDRTVEWHIDKAMKKLGARNRIQAVVLAIRDGLIASVS